MMKFYCALKNLDAMEIAHGPTMHISSSAAPTSKEIHITEAQKLFFLL